MLPMYQYVFLSSKYQCIPRQIDRACRRHHFREWRATQERMISVSDAMQADAACNKLPVPPSNGTPRANFMRLQWNCHSTLFSIAGTQRATRKITKLYAATSIK